MRTEYWFVIGFFVLAGLVVGYAAYDSQKPGRLDTLAQCIADSGATFYGAFWCPHCQAQKEMFGKSSELLPYLECSTPDGQGQLPVCEDAGIEGYPTWEFADGERLSGVVELDTLAERTGCALPQE